MKCNICLSVYLFVFFTETVSGMDPDGIKLTLQELIPMLKDLTLNIKDYKFKIPETWNDYAAGTAEFQKNSISGLETANLDLIEANLLTPKKEKLTQNNITFELTFDKIVIFTDYKLDIALLNTVPLYGSGTFSFGIAEVHIFSNVKFTDKHFRNMRLDDLILKIRIKEYNESYITGFWNNDEVSNYITTEINLVSQFIIWILNLLGEPCIDCVLSNSMEYIINSVIDAKKIYPVYCSCIKENWKESLGGILDGGIFFAKKMLGI
ncbi:unnamed protein product [Psylliodes chrysocephalus]|uniref:Uncharacterized protein n=1 Tax=Psylliodes chrysocephalus TaxID=3402493 RepID=A0A9P0CR85_9CUCU|nr:unnamed protein product [Psylliodes chrysocephala]